MTKVIASNRRKVNLVKRNLKTVTSIFIDVEKSSARANQIDPLDYESVISEFANSCANIFTEFGAEVGPFLGDGIAGFMFSPSKENEKTSIHSKTAIEIGLKVLEMVESQQSQIVRLWKAPFNIRVGISTGLASVGFFPNEKYGCYTAVGRSVSLSARLCDIAKINTICIDQRSFAGIDKRIKMTQVDNGGTLSNIKGFEKDAITVLSVYTRNRVRVSNVKCKICNHYKFILNKLYDTMTYQCSNCETVKEEEAAKSCVDNSLSVPRTSMHENPWIMNIAS